MKSTFPRFKDHTILGTLVFDDKTGGLSIETYEIYFKDIKEFNNLPEVCRSPEVLEDYNNWVNENRGKK